MKNIKTITLFCNLCSFALLQGGNLFTNMQKTMQKGAESVAASITSAPQKINTEGFTPLMKAIAENNADEVKKLLQQGASPIEAAQIKGTNTYINVFRLAQNSKNIAIITLINNALRPYTERSFNFIKALNPRNERFDDAKAIFKQGINVNAQDKFGKMPLAYASYEIGAPNHSRFADLVDQMIKMGAEFNLLIINNNTPATVHIAYSTQPGSGIRVGSAQPKQQNVKMSMPADRFIVMPEGPMCYSRDSETNEIDYSCGSNVDDPIKFSSGDIWNIEHVEMGPNGWKIKKSGQIPTTL